MANPIKYNTSAETLALKKGNFYIGTGDVGKGPTSSTGYYNGITPPSGGFTIYLNKASEGPAIYTVSTEAQLTSLTNRIAGTNYTTSGACLNWFATQTDKMIFNIDYPAIVTNGLVLNLDAAFTPSYPTTATTWYDLSSSVNNGTLTNGPTFSSVNGGSIVFDGANDYVAIPSLVSTAFTFNQWIKKTSTSSSCTSSISNQGTLLRVNNTQIAWWSDVNAGPNTYDFTPNLNQWYNIAVCQLNDIVNIYLNSVLIISGGTPSPNLTFGRNTIGSWGGSCGWLGDIATTQIYNRALTAAEVQQNYEAIGTRYTTLQVQSLIVAGGGSGGGFGYPSGGGGAGGLLTGYTTSLSLNTNYTITVGAGGSSNSNGSNSVFNTSTSIGGGRGGNGRSASGVSGGSGGGGGSNYPADLPSPYLTPAGSGTVGQGNDGGVGKSVYGDTSVNGVPTGAGGGGGAGAVGGTGTITPSIKAGDGGVGRYFSEYSTIGGYPSGWFAGGGGGSTSYSSTATNAVGVGGNGGGGNGSYTQFSSGPSATDGIVNSGGGGGGAGYIENSSANGGSGIVILRIPDVYTARFSSGVSASVTKSGGYKYYKVTATSTTSETVSFS